MGDFFCLLLWLCETQGEEEEEEKEVESWCRTTPYIHARKRDAYTHTQRDNALEPCKRMSSFCRLVTTMMLRDGISRLGAYNTTPRRTVPVFSRAGVAHVRRAVSASAGRSGDVFARRGRPGVVTSWASTRDGGSETTSSSGGGGGGDGDNETKMNKAVPDFSHSRQFPSRKTGKVVTDLHQVPGVGPRNEALLLSKGLDSQSKLSEILVEECKKDKDRLTHYLNNDVGIFHKHHCLSIADHIANYVDEMESHESGSSSNVTRKSKKVTLCVEGNISVGKTTFLQNIIRDCVALKDIVEIIPEPVDEWQRLLSYSKDQEPHNVLKAFYSDPSRWGYTFQNYVFVSRMMQHQKKDIENSAKELKLFERSVFSDRMVFAQAVHEARFMNDMEMSIYNSWFDPMVASMPALVPDAFIYLRADPRTCLTRMYNRARSEEGGIDLHYLQSLHEKHDRWLFSKNRYQFKSVSGDKAAPQIPRSIADKVYLLDQTCPKAIQNVPTLILDCDQHINFHLDLDVKRQYGEQVRSFFEYIKKKREYEESSAQHTAVYSPSQQLMRPPSSMRMTL